MNQKKQDRYMKNLKNTVKKKEQRFQLMERLASLVPQREKPICLLGKIKYLFMTPEQQIIQQMLSSKKSEPTEI